MSDNIILAQSSWPKIDYSGVEGFQPTQVVTITPEPPTAAEQIVNDPTNLILLAILGAVVVGVIVLKKRMDAS